MSSPVFDDKNARRLAFLISYQRSFLGEAKLSEQWLIQRHKLSLRSQKMLKDKLNTYHRNQALIDQWINNWLANWKPDRLHLSLRCLLRVAIAELLNHQDLRIVINESLELAKSYLPEESAKVCHALLDKIWQQEVKAVLVHRD